MLHRQTLSANYSAATDTDAIHDDIATDRRGAHDHRTPGSDATGTYDTAGTDDGIRVIRLHGQHRGEHRKCKSGKEK